ncbi:MAG: sugar transferase [Syntrophobacteraceae bacterium]|nr:sugar transferase [Syntrophobacteraceae bacterium]MDR3561373.1 sugar transferase [Negativicutes bacterium]
MWKRTFDLVAASLVLCLTSPLIVLIALLIKRWSPGPVFYRGVRTGLHGKPFRIFKFRTMVVDAEHIGGPSTALNDTRLTPIGKILRRYKLDELPQLFNILLGDMSVVGPRPQVERYTSLYAGPEKAILDVRPGLTDYASIRFIDLDAILGDENVDEKYLREVEPEKNRLRLQYARNHNFRVDLDIIFTTLRQMLSLRSKWNTQR